MPVKPGDILNDKLRIDALIGRGGMGQVFAATDLDERTQVAVKVVSRLFVDETLMLRLHREAVAAQRIRSDYVPRVFEVADTGEGETYLVMERLMGEPLSARIRSQGSLPWPEVARVGEEMLRGLIDAHSAGIIHRDLKPSNVFLALKTGRVRAMILDFGVCKMDGLDTERLTGTGESIGTVAYMAPEQIRGAAKVDERADLYAFGVVIFEMLSGRLPHEGPSQMAILASKLEKESARLRDCVRSPIPEALDALVMQCLERDPRGRQASAQEVLRQWRILARAEGLISGPSVPPPGLGGPDLRQSRPTGPQLHNNDNEPPTEISKPDALPGILTGEVEAILNGSSSDDDRLPNTEGARVLVGVGMEQAPADFNSMFPPPSHPTEAPITSSPMASHDFGANKSTNARIYAMGGGAAALIALCIFAFALSRPEPKRTAAKPPAAATTETAAAEPAPAAPDSTDPAPAQTITADDSMELPSEPSAENVSSKAPATVNQSRPRPVYRPRPPPPAPKPSNNTPRITEKPRF